MASGGMYAQRLYDDDPEYTLGDYSGTAYTKRMQVHLAEEWARVLEPEGTTVHSMHPGWAATPGSPTRCPPSTR